ncbi:MAG: glycosyltransferase, partial [Bacteroidales bacterium]
QYASEQFRLLFLSSTLLFTVLFSTSTESYGYITAMVAVCIWYITTPSKETTPHLNTALFVFCFILTSLSTTDIFPAFIRKAYVIPYALKALPCTLIWCKIIWEQLTIDFIARPHM